MIREVKVMGEGCCGGSDSGKDKKAKKKKE